MLFKSYYLIVVGNILCISSERPASVLDCQMMAETNIPSLHFSSQSQIAAAPYNLGTAASRESFHLLYQMLNFM